MSTRLLSSDDAPSLSLPVVRGNPVPSEGMLPPGWHGATSLVPESLASEPLPAQTAVVIVGGGLTAHALAYAFALQQVPVVVLSPWSDAGDPSVSGPGLLMPGLGEEPLRLARALGIGVAGELLTFSAGGVARSLALCQTLQVPFQPTAAVMGARVEADLPDLLGTDTLLASWGLKASWLSQAEARACSLPTLAGGVLWPTAGLVCPGTFSTRLAEAAIQAGALYFPATSVLAVRDEGAGLQVQTSRGTMGCELLVHAGGAAVEPAHAFLKTVMLPARARLLWLASSPASGSTPAREATVRSSTSGSVRLPGTCASGYDHWRPLGQAETPGWLVGGMRYRTLEQGLDWWQTVPEPAIDEGLETMGQGLFAESMGPARVQGRWTRLLDIPCDGLPVVGSLPGQSRQLVVVGLAGLDSTLGVEAAFRLVDTVLELGQLPPIPEILSPRRML